VTDEGMSELSERIREADAIVAGTVTGIESVDHDTGGAISHHEPLWLAVKIRIDSVLKGDVPGETVVAEIARSPDPRVDSGLRPEVGQMGIWILHPGAGGTLTMTHSLDHQPFEGASHVQQLLS
jgi:hypothetical protein